jgi:hypothetical protein
LLFKISHSLKRALAAALLLRRLLLDFLQVDRTDFLLLVAGSSVLFVWRFPWRRVLVIFFLAL